MKSSLLTFLFITLAGILLIREQKNGTFAMADDYLMSGIESISHHGKPKPLVTMVRHNEQSADISGSPQLTDVDIALFLRTAFKFSPLSVGIAGDLGSKDRNALVTDILNIQTSRYTGIYFGLLFSSQTERYSPVFNTPGNLKIAGTPPFQFSGLSSSIDLPKNVAVGFLNIDEIAARKNLIPSVASYHHAPLPSFALIGLLTSIAGNKNIPDAGGYLKIRERAESLIESISLDELLLKMERFESTKKSDSLDTLLSGRAILLGLDSEADRTIVLASGKKYSPLHVEALLLATLLSGKSVVEISPYWNLGMSPLLFFPILFLTRLGWLGRFTAFVILFLFAAAASIGLYHYTALWLPPIPSLGMALGFLIAALFTPAGIKSSPVMVANPFAQ
ncbi:MAG: hypothetical protein ABIP97_05815 [Chthoniobacterales bacterium]